jgi:hypothetical protein
MRAIPRRRISASRLLDLGKEILRPSAPCCHVAAEVARRGAGRLLVYPASRAALILGGSLLAHWHVWAQERRLSSRSGWRVRRSHTDQAPFRLSLPRLYAHKVRDQAAGSEPA